MKTLTRREFLEAGFLGFAGTLAGCMEIRPEGKFKIDKERQDDLFDRYKEYWVERTAEENLVRAAGIISGKIKVFRQDKIYSTEGEENYHKEDDLEAYEEALRRADRRSDKIVTRQEAHDFFLRLVHGY